MLCYDDHPWWREFSNLQLFRVWMQTVVNTVQIVTHMAHECNVEMLNIGAILHFFGENV